MNKLKKSLLFALLIFTLPGFINAQHFNPVWTTPFQPMFFTINKALLDGVNLVSGDEIAVFDGSLCVGAKTLSGPISLSSPLLFQASTDDGSGNGFTAGHTIIFKIWDNSAGLEVTFAVPTYQPGSNTVFTSLGSANVSLFAATNGVTWTGASGSTWNSTANWSTTSIPTSSTTVVIPTGLTNYPTLSSAGSCKDILLQADASGMASILGNNNLSVSGNAYVETYISADQWHIVSSPLGSQQTGVFYLNGNPKVFIMEFNENANDYSYIANTNVSLQDMTGYMLWVNSPPASSDGRIFTYIGSLNNGTFGSSNNMLNTNQGWNQVGNPYPSAIDWDASSGWTKTNVNNAIYIITDDGNWASYVNGSPGPNGGSRYIAPGQGFFVKVSSAGSGTLQMNNNVRLHNSVGFLKSITSINWVMLSATGYGITDETVIRFVEESTAEFDSEFDAYKKFSTNDSVPQLYSYSDVEYSINSIPESESVQLGFSCGVDGEYTIEKVMIENLENLWLEDLKTGIITNLITDNYTFNYQYSENPERFTLHFAALSVNENNLDDLIIFTSQNWINIRSKHTIEGQVEVYNLLGQKVNSDKLLNGITKISVNQRGYYLVKIVSGKTTSTKKVFIQ